MSKKALLVAPVTALLLGLSGVGPALAASAEPGTSMRGGPGMMQNGDTSGMGGMRSEEMPGQRMGGGMMGMMGGGMMNMMNSCPMMEGASGADRKVMMQMHGEMMRAMGDIMIKYADKLDAPSSSR